MLALCSMLLGTYYAQNYASIIGGSLKKMLLGISWYCQFEQIIRNQYQVRPAEGGGKIGWDGTRGAGTS